MKGALILPMPLVRWANYTAFNDGGGFDAVVAECLGGASGPSGTFWHARTDHLEEELVLIRVVFAEAGPAIWCHAGLRQSEPVMRDLGRRFRELLDPVPLVQATDAWTVYSWAQRPRRRPSGDQ
jgi:hypothetical protein